MCATEPALNVSERAERSAVYRPGLHRSTVCAGDEDSARGGINMFENAQGAAVVAAKDLARAKSFYEGVLGLTPEETPSEEDAVLYRLGGVPLMVYVTSYAGTAKNTVFAIDTD